MSDFTQFHLHFVVYCFVYVRASDVAGTVLTGTEDMSLGIAQIRAKISRRLDEHLT